MVYSTLLLLALPRPALIPPPHLHLTATITTYSLDLFNLYSLVPPRPPHLLPWPRSGSDADTWWSWYPWYVVVPSCQCPFVFVILIPFSFSLILILWTFLGICFICNPPLGSYRLASFSYDDHDGITMNWNRLWDLFLLNLTFTFGPWTLIFLYRFLPLGHAWPKRYCHNLAISPFYWYQQCILVGPKRLLHISDSTPAYCFIVDTDFVRGLKNGALTSVCIQTDSFIYLYIT